jgi:hypothetical protein
MIDTLFFAFTFLNSSAYSTFDSLEYKQQHYGLPYCIIQLNLEDAIFDLFGFTYPPLVMQTTQEQTNYAFMMIKYQYMHSIVPCIQSIDPNLYEKKRPLLKYDKMHLEFTNYILNGLRYSTIIGWNQYPLFEVFFEPYLSILKKSSSVELTYNGNLYKIPDFLWRPKYYFFMEQWKNYFERRYY